MKLRLSTYLTITLFLNISIISNAQQINRFFSMGAGNEALGNSNVSNAYDVSSMYLNPSTLVFMKSNSILVNHTDIRNYLGMEENISYPILINDSHAFSVGLDIYHFGYFSIDRNDNYGGQQILEVGYNGAYATTITPTLSVGALVSFHNGKTNSSQIWSGSYAVGFNYTPSADASYGLVLRGLGWDIQYVTNQDNSLKAEKITLLKSIEVGSTMSYPTSASLRRKFFVLSLSNEKVFTLKGLIYKAGIEISPYAFLKLRFGYIYGTNNGLNEPRFGLAFKYNKISFEYTYFPHKSSVIFDQLSFSVGI